jgi:predicted transcriptional regulator
MNNTKSKPAEIENLIDDMINDRIPNNVTIFLDLGVLAEIFTKRRMELVKKIDEVNPQSIQELAEELDRKKQAVHRDLKLLEGHNIIELVKNGKKVVPIISKELIYIPIKQFSKLSGVKELIKDKEEKIIDALPAEVYIGESNINELMREIVE